MKRSSRTCSSKPKMPELLEQRCYLSANAANLTDALQPSSGISDPGELPFWFTQLEPAGTYKYAQAKRTGDSGGPQRAGVANPPPQPTRWIVNLAHAYVGQMHGIRDLETFWSDSKIPIRIASGLGARGLVLMESYANAEEIRDLLGNDPRIAHFRQDATIVGQASPVDSGTAQRVALSQVNVDKVWQDFEQRGIPSVIVGVLDTGIDLAHRDLYLNIWINQGEIPPQIKARLTDIDDDGLFTLYDLNHCEWQDELVCHPFEGPNNSFTSDLNANGYIDADDLLRIWSDSIDEDSNGWIDDLVGWNFHDNNNRPFDDHRHGTHVAGTIGAIGGNRLDIRGINWHSSMMALKILDANNRGSSANAIAAMNYLTMMKTSHDVNVRVTNNSFVGAEFDPDLQRAIARSGDADILNVAAAGNGNILGDGENIDDKPRYPASYRLDNIIAVAATNSNGDELASFSNFGSCDVVECAVDLAAPGIGIVSTNPFGTVSTGGAPTLNAGTASWNGTSMAAPHVTGVAALIFAQDPDVSAIEAKEAILVGARRVPALQGLVATGGVLDAAATFEALQETPTARLVAATSIFAPTEDAVTLTIDFGADHLVDSIDLTSLGDVSVILERHGFPARHAVLELRHACWYANGCIVDLPHDQVEEFRIGVVRATYHIPAPIRPEELEYPAGWQAIDNGMYHVTLDHSQIRNREGVGNRVTSLVSEGLNSTFEVAINDSSVLVVNTVRDLLEVDAGEQSLRSAVRLANETSEDNTIVLGPGVFQLEFPGVYEDRAAAGDLDVRANGSLTIVGAGRGVTVVDAAELDRVFHVLPGAHLRLLDLTLQRGRADVGAGIANRGKLDVWRTMIQQNSADIAGGGIWNAGSASFTDSTIDGNQVASPLGTGGGGIYSQGGMVITRSTISHNLANGGLSQPGAGGGLFLNSPDAPIAILNSTISGNRVLGGHGGGVTHVAGEVGVFHATITNNFASEAGGGIWIEPAIPSMQITNSIIAGNAVRNGPPDVAGEPQPFGNTLIGIISNEWTANSQPLWGTTDRPVNALLGPLSDNGGPTQTHLLLPDSPAVGRASPLPFHLGTDQRGLPRPDQFARASSLGATQPYFVEFRGRFFQDIDGNGQRELTEPSLENWVVFADLNDNGLLDPAEPNVLTRVDDPTTPLVDESEYVIRGVDPEIGKVTIRSIPRPGFVDSTPVVVAPASEELIENDFRLVVGQTPEIHPVFHLDFSMPADRLHDVSAAQLPIRVGQAVETRAAGGPNLQNGRQLDSGRWLGTNDDENEIVIFDHPILDRTSQSAGSVVSWVKVDDEREWNSILWTACHGEFESPTNCDQFSRTRGLELDANVVSGVFGSVQGWNTNNFGPRHETNAGEGGSETPSDVWTHVALTWNEAGDHTIYVDGVKGRTIEGVGAEPFGLNDPHHWTIGGADNRVGRSYPFADENQRKLRGELADFAIYPVELDGQTINDLIRNGVPKPAKPIVHLDFSQQEIADFASHPHELKIHPGIAVQAQQGPLLQSGDRLSSALWSDANSHRGIEVVHESDSQALNTAGAVVTWVKTTSESEWNSVFSTLCPIAACDTANQYSLTINENAQIKANTPRSGNLSQTNTSPESLSTGHVPDDVWTHLAFSWNDHGDYTLYVNGIPGTRQLGSGAASLRQHSQGNWLIGGSSPTAAVADTGNSGFRGELADFAIFDGELDRKLVNEIMRLGVPKPVEPVFHLTFDGEIEDQSTSELTVSVGDNVSIQRDAGPTLDSGRTLNAGAWSGNSGNGITIPDNETLDRVSRQAGTVATWIRVDDQREWNNILWTACQDLGVDQTSCTEYSRTRGLELDVNAQSGAFGSVQGWSTNSFGPRREAEPNAEDFAVWTHIAMAWNAAGDHTIFVNGVPGKTIRGVGGDPFGLNDPHDWVLGGSSVHVGANYPHEDPNGRRLRGSLADFAIYDAELRSAEIRQIMSTGVATFSNWNGLRRGVQALAGFDSHPSIVGDRIVFKDHLGRVLLSDVDGNYAPVVGINTVSTSERPFADDQRVSYDGEFVAFTGQLEDIVSPSPTARGSSIFVVNQFGAFDELVSTVTSPPGGGSFVDGQLRVHSISNAVVAFGVEHANPSGGQVNQQGIYAADRAVGLAVLANSNTLVPGTSVPFESFGDVQLGETEFASTFVLHGTFKDGFGIYQKIGGGPLETVVDHTSTIDGKHFTDIVDFAFSDGDIVFQATTESTTGLFLWNEQGIQRLVDTNTSIPGRDDQFASFGAYAFDRGNIVFLGRAVSADAPERVLGIYGVFNGQLRRIVNLDAALSSTAFGGRRPVTVSLGPESISGNRVVFYVSFEDGTDAIFSAQFDAESKYEIELAPGQLVTGLDFGRHPLPGQIRGQSYDDANRNGRRDSDEAGLPGWVVYLDDNQNGTLDSGEASTTTGETGAFAFHDLPTERTYTVRQVPQADWVTSARFGASYEFHLSAAEVREDIDFGNRSTGQVNGQGGNGVIRVSVFRDDNEDGKHGPSEPTIGGRSLYIDVNNNGIFDSFVDVEPQFVDGSYEFSNLAMVPHQIRLVQSSNLQQTSPLGNSFDTFTKENIGIRPTAVVSGDFDGDGAVDLVIANNTSNTLSFVSDSAVSSDVTSVINHGGNGPISIAVADANDDGQLDLAVANFHSSNISVLLGRGDGRFSSPRIYSTGERSGPVVIKWLDANGDGALDLVVSNSASEVLSLFLNRGEGFFEPGTIENSIGRRPQGLVTGDFSGDGNDDIVVVSQLDKEVRVLVSDSDGSFSVVDRRSVGGFPSGIVAADFDGDQLLDIAVGNLGSSTMSPSVSILFGAGQGMLHRPQNIHLDSPPLGLAAVDVDRDADVDLVLTRNGTPPISLLRNDGFGNFQSASVTGAADLFNKSALAFSIAAADVNGDGLDDFILANRDSNSLTILENRIVEGTHRVILETSSPIQEIAFGVLFKNLPGDADRDGAVDFEDFLILSQHFGQDIIGGWEHGDFDEDGHVSFADFLLLAENFGKTLVSRT